MKTCPYLDYYRQQGAGVFIGPAIQRGTGFANIFKSLTRFIKPVFKSITPMIRKAAPVIGGELLNAGRGLLVDTLRGHNVGDAAASRFQQAGENLKEAAIQQLEGQEGSGLKRKRLSRPRHSSHRRPRKRTKRDLFD